MHRAPKQKPANERIPAQKFTISSITTETDTSGPFY